MKKIILLPFISLLFLVEVICQKNIPQAEIKNELIHARLYLPDVKNGYYRGSRFDWAGVIPSLVYKGHQYFGQWFEKYSPTLHDAIMGPVEAFAPIGYEETKVGNQFLVIGVGMVTKPEEAKYAISTPYKLVHAGKWKVKAKPDQVDFTHTLKGAKYAYEYKKTVALTAGKPDLVLTHSLKNRGKATIETTVYNHNFFVMDSTTIGPGYEVKFPFSISGEARDNPDLVTIEASHIILVKDILPKKFLYFAGIEGFGPSYKDYNISIENHKTGAGVRITSDQPIFKLPLWSATKTLCPEPYIKLSIPPGETFKWSILYEFYECEIN
ncbi:MAG: hypothetical protein ABIR66_00895 [Saprospiraceae bacterium]